MIDRRDWTICANGADNSRYRTAFDFFGTLRGHSREIDADICYSVRDLARRFFTAGYEVHIVSAISPGLPADNDEAYAEMLKELAVPFTKIWRVDHKPELKLAVLMQIQPFGFWDDVKENVDLARAYGFACCHVGVDDLFTTTKTVQYVTEFKFPQEPS